MNTTPTVETYVRTFYFFKVLAPLIEALADTRIDDAMEEAGVKTVILRR